MVHLTANIKSGLSHPIASSLHRIVDHRIQASPFLFSFLVPSFYTLASGRAHTVLLDFCEILELLIPFAEL